MRGKIFGLWVISIGLLFFHNVYGQTIQSPYSTFGVGDRQTTANTAHLGMGGIGIGGGHPLLLNTRNSAWLARNHWTIFDFGVEGDYRTLTTSNSVNTLASGGLRNLSFGFPITNKPEFGWTASASLRPYSTVQYRIFREDSVSGPLNTVATIQQGNGGYNSVNWGNGFRFGENLFVGLKGTYLFGTIAQEAISSFSSVGVEYTNDVSLAETKEVDDFLWEASLGYQLKIAEETHLRVGAVYQGAANVNTDVLRTLTLQYNEFNPIRQILLDSGSTTEYLPFNFGAGISVEKQSHWLIGLDFDYQPWSQYRDTQGNASENLGDNWRLSIGSQFTPEWNSTRYLRRVGYSLGGHFEQSPLVFNGNPLNDFGINFGISLPVSRAGSSLNMGLQLGSRGTTTDNLIRENYVKLNLGIAFNQLWFMRSKYD